MATLFVNANLMTMSSSRESGDIIRAGAVGISDGRIVFVGTGSNIPASFDGGSTTRVDCGGRLVTPGLIDCHTHLVHGGDRCNEFEMRLRGATYQDIAKAGGGIASTVMATRSASDDALLSSALRRLDSLMAEGVTTIEVKSGYGLDLVTEQRMLRVARKLGLERSVTVLTSFLGAHALPKEAAGDRAAYLKLVTETMLPAIVEEGLADAVDGFCETIAFSPDEIERLFRTAAAMGLPVKLHADQLSDTGGAALAARHRALSADHLEYASAEGAEAMARAGTVAVLLPGAYYFLREPKAPPVGAFRQYGTRMAIATDCNPGTSPLTSLLVAMNMAATLFRLTVDECLAGVTREAACALGLGGEVGTIETGKRGDLAIWNVEAPAQLVCRIGSNPLHARVWRGNIEMSA